jgi:hypothetical protein
MAEQVLADIRPPPTHIRRGQPIPSDDDDEHVDRADHSLDRITRNRAVLEETVRQDRLLAEPSRELATQSASQASGVIGPVIDVYAGRRALRKQRRAALAAQSRSSVSRPGAGRATRTSRQVLSRAPRSAPRPLKPRGRRLLVARAAGRGLLRTRTLTRARWREAFLRGAWDGTCKARLAWMASSPQRASAVARRANATRS